MKIRPIVARASMPWIGMWCGLALAFGSAPAAADEIYAVLDGALQGLGVDERVVEPVGPLDFDVVSLSFSEDGRLLGLTRDWQIYEIDRQTADSTLVSTLPSEEGYSYDQLTAVGTDWAYLARRTEPFGLDEIVLARLSSGDVSVIGPPYSAEHPDRRFFLDSLSLLHGALMGFGDVRSEQKLFSISPANGAATALSPELRTIPISSDADSDGDVWHVSDTVITPPDYLLYPIDPGTGEGIPEKAFYIFRFPPPFAVYRDRAGTCRPNETTLCFLDGRFRVTAEWRDDSGGSGPAGVVSGASDNAGLMWFFDPKNWEVSVKLLDGCGLNDRVWLFLSGTTNVELTVTVEDVVSGQRRFYENPLSTNLETVLDTEAFSSCGP